MSIRLSANREENYENTVYIYIYIEADRFSAEFAVQELHSIGVLVK